MTKVTRISSIPMHFLNIYTLKHMAILKVETTYMDGMKNTVIINTDVEEVKPFS
jgi:hypothetical protein